jgi:hypothetical protein
MNETKRMRSIVWAELAHACYWEQYISRYLGHRYDFNKLYSILTIVLSSLGAFFIALSKSEYEWAVWAGIGCVVTVPVVQIVNSSQKHVMMDVDTASSLLRLRGLYLVYYDELARLFLDIDDLSLSEEQIKDRYFSIRRSAVDIERLKDSLNISRLNKVDRHAMRQMNKRLSHKFGTIGCLTA